MYSCYGVRKALAESIIYRRRLYFSPVTIGLMVRRATHRIFIQIGCFAQQQRS